MILIAMLAIGGFLVALVFFAWCLQGLVEFMITHWARLGRVKRVGFSALFLFTLSLALEGLASFDKYFKVLLGG